MSMFQKVPQRDGMNSIDNSCMTLLNFQKLILAPNKAYSGKTGDREYLILIMGGKCTVSAGGKDFPSIGARPNVFGGKPHSVYVPRGTDFHISAATAPVEIALCSAPSDLKTDPYHIKPEDVAQGTWGATNFTRHYYSILDQRTPAQRLFVGETYVPSGNWATYPPHKHEKDNIPSEVYMEEIYYYKINPQEGFALDRHYTDDGSIDRADVIKDETVLLIPRGYHTTVATPGYQLYYLWFLAGHIRQQCPKLDPDLAWVQKTIPIVENSRVNL